MLKSALRCLLVATVVLSITTEVSAQYDRRNAIVAAVEKTREGVVMLEVRKENGNDVVGTGVVIDERGFAVTNNHVVNEAASVVAVMADGSKVPCEIHATYPKNDLAVLRMSVSKKLKALTFAPGSDLMVGETIIAVGNPHGFKNSVCTGIVSALGRVIEMPNGEKLTNLIQHSAPINPGNSGGPLFNINGDLIGLNVALRDGAQSISFALNSEMIKTVLSRQLSAAKVSSIEHGLTVSEKVETEGKDRQKVVVAAAKAGLEKGDVLVKMGNLKVSNKFDLERSFWGYKTNDTITATVLRDGKQTTVSLTIGQSELLVSAR